MSEVISARYLEATARVLDAESRDLVHHINSISRRGPLTRGPLLPGQPVHHNYALDIRADDAKAIFSVLKSAMEKYGKRYAIYDGVTFDQLTDLWRCYAARLEAASA